MSSASAPPRRQLVRLSTWSLLVAALFTPVAAHEHHHDGPAVVTGSDSGLTAHIAVQAFTWTILFPTTMVLGMTRHRLHVPLAVLSLALTTVGYMLGHGHKGWTFPHTAHGTVASLLVFYLFAQASLGTYLKLHLKWKAEAWVRPPVLALHGFLGKTFPILGWVQMVLGIATLQSWCFGGNLGQCLAHYIMGSSFIAYSAILLIMLKAGAGWLARRGKSQEWFDSWVICLWGLVNSFTEHHGGPWTHKDLQHTLLGVVWFFGGAVGIWTSRRGKRSIFPGIIIAITGWAMSGHAQALMLSTMVHALFGYALMAAGLARIVEVCFVLNDRPTGEVDSAPDPDSTEPPHERSTAGTPVRTPEQLAGRPDWSPVRAFQFLPPWLLTAAGILFMSATDEELRWADSKGVDHITWGLIDFSVAFFLFLWFNMLVELYTTSGGRYGSRVSSAGNARGGPGAMESGRGRSWYQRLSVGAGGTHSNDDSTVPLTNLGSQRRGLSDQGNDSNHRPNGHANGKSRQQEKYEDDDGGSGSGSGSGSHRHSQGEETHVLFDEGDLDAGEIDPFDDEAHERSRRPAAKY